MATLRRLLLIALLVVLVLTAAVFAYSNPDPVSVDIGVARLERVPASIAFLGAFAVGWAFGLVTVSLAMLRMVNERRRLKRDLRFAEAEIRSLRSMPLNDAN